MKILKDFGKTLAHLALVFALLVGVGNVFVSHDAKATTQDGVWLNAAQLETLRLILNSFGVAVWPNYASDPFTCNSNVEGAYYFNTTSSAFTVCDGSSWAAGGGGVANLNDLGDVAVAAPSDGEVLRYDGVTDMRWENQAASASAIDDLSDVEAPTPSDGDILLYDGTVDNRWESTPGAAPTTLAGLSDTTLTTPAEGDYLIRNGTDWKNVNPSGSYVIFPYNNAHGSLSYTAGNPIAVANDVRVYRVAWPYGCEVDSITWAVDAQTGAGCTHGAVGLYSLDGNTKILDSGAEAYDTNDEIFDIDITDTYVEQGSYWIAYTQNSISSCTVRAHASPSTSVPSVPLMLNTGNTLVGTAANQSVVGALPATLGAISANSTSVLRPLIKFVCVDP